MRMSQRRGLALGLAVTVLAGGVLLGQQGAPASTDAAGATAERSTFPPLPSVPPTYPQQTPQPLQGMPAVTPTRPGQIPAFDTEALRTWVTHHPLPGTAPATTMPTVASIDCSLTAVQASKSLDGQSVNVPDGTPVCLVVVMGSFTFADVPPPRGTAVTPTSYPDGFEVFDATTGNLLMDGGLAVPPGSATPQSGG
jgi:hypothetical protein